MSSAGSEPETERPEALRPRRRASDRIRSRDVVNLLAMLMIAFGLYLAVKADHRSERADVHATSAIASVKRLALAVASQQQSNTTALCSFRGELAQRLAESREFLQRHPAGIPGVPVSALTVSQANETSSLQALSPLKCGPKPRHKQRKRR